MSLLSAQWHQSSNANVASISHTGRVRVYFTAVDVGVPSKLLVYESGPEASAELAAVEIPVGSGGDGFVDVETIAGDLGLSWQPGTAGDGELRVKVLGRP